MICVSFVQTDMLHGMCHVCVIRLTLLHVHVFPFPCLGWWQRFWTTWAMLGGFVLIIYMGHPALVAFVFFLQTMMFKEIKRLANVLSQEQDKPPVRPLQW